MSEISNQVECSQLEPVRTLQLALIEYENKWKEVEQFIIEVAQADIWNAGHAKLIGARFKDDATAILAKWITK